MVVFECCVEFGPRVYGLQAGSNYYFKKGMLSRLSIGRCNSLLHSYQDRFYLVVDTKWSYTYRIPKAI